MTILRRVEMLEAAVGRTNEGDCYKVVMLKEGESYEEGIVRDGLTDWPSDRILAICFEVPKTADLPLRIKASGVK